jgi:NADPH:quinone reductase-like Zn-dependent oxidoreductase
MACQVGGTYAEYCVVDSADLCLKPDPIPSAQAAAIPFAALSAFSAV